MSNIHAPTIPSGPTTVRHTNGNNQHLSFTELQRKKDAMEAELKALGSVLDSHNVDMHTSLLTPDGFPRADLDVAQIRTARSRIIHLRNDYKELMSTIEKFLHEHFASLSEDANGEAATGTPTTNGTGGSASILPDSIPDVLEAPFAKVNTVVDSSPAAEAGLKAGDQIRRFGYVDHSNHDSLRRVGECVQGNEGQRILVKIARSTGSGLEELTVSLTPRRDWGGRGLLGCHILPL